MPTSVHWGDKEIFVYQSDLLQTQATPIEVYRLNINDFHLDLRTLEESFLGMPKDVTHSYEPPSTLAGVTFARKLEIINDYTITFLPDLPWRVDIDGGNSNIADRVNPNNVSVNTANSAGLQDAESLQISSFLGAITVDPGSGISGTTFPIGTPGFPVDNLTDAKEIAMRVGIRAIRAIASMTITGIDLSEGFTFTTDRYGVLLTLDPSAELTNCSFQDIAITGTLDSNNRFYRCDIVNAYSLQAKLVDSGILGTLELGGGTTQLVNCHSDVAGGGPGQYPTIDLGGTGSDLFVRDWSGGLQLENYSGGNEVSLDIDSGRVVVASDVTGGNITIRGIAEVEDNSTGTANIIDDTLTELVFDTRRYSKNRKQLNRATGQLELFDDTGTNVKETADAYEDSDGTIPLGPASTKVDRTDGFN